MTETTFTDPSKILDPTESKFIFSCCHHNDVPALSACDENAFSTDIGKNIHKHSMAWQAQHGKLPSTERIEKEFGCKLIPTKDTPDECLTDLKNVAQFVAAKALYQQLTKTFQDNADRGRDEAGFILQEVVRKSQERLAKAFQPQREVRVGEDSFTDRYLGILQERRNRGGLLKIQYPWPSANKATLGIDDGQLIAIVGRPGDGKTTMLIYLLCHVWEMVTDGPIMVISNEINSVSMADRIVATTLGYDYSKIRSGDIDEDQARSALEQYMRNPICIMDAEGLGAASIDLVKIKAVQSRAKMLFIDGAYLMKAAGKDMYAGAAQISSDCKSLAMSLNIPVVITWQLNRNAGDGSGASTATIAFSDRLSTDADVIAAVFATEDQVESGTRNIRSVKVRDGSDFEFIIECDYSTMSFAEITSPDTTTSSLPGLANVEDLI